MPFFLGVPKNDFWLCSSFLGEMDILLFGKRSHSHNVCWWLSGNLSKIRRAPPQKGDPFLYLDLDITIRLVMLWSSGCKKQKLMLWIFWSSIYNKTGFFCDLPENFKYQMIWTFTSDFLKTVRYFKF